MVFGQGRIKFAEMASKQTRPRALHEGHSRLRLTLQERDLIDAMSTNDQDRTRDFWNRIADDWYVQVGDEGDSNRILNSDPVLWDLAGEVAGLKVLDAGCGTGYLSRQLHELGAHVTGVDFSERMCEIASAKNPGIVVSSRLL